jgi:hypothetical protein
VGEPTPHLSPPAESGMEVWFGTQRDERAFSDEITPKIPRIRTTTRPPRDVAK